MINKHKSHKIKENSNTVRHLNNGTDHRHSKSCCDQSSPARRTINIGSYFIWHLNTRSRRLSLSKSESPASHPSVTCLFQCGAIESPDSRRKMRVLHGAVLARGDWSLLYDKLAISNTYSHAKNRNDPRPITLSKVAFLESGFSAVDILGGSNGPPC